MRWPAAKSYSMTRQLQASSRQLQASSKMDLIETYCDHCGELLMSPPWQYDARDERGTRILVRCRVCGQQSGRYAPHTAED